MRRRMLPALLSCCLCLALVRPIPAQEKLPADGRPSAQQPDLAGLEQRVKVLEATVKRLQAELAASRGYSLTFTGGPAVFGLTGGGRTDNIFRGVGGGVSSGVRPAGGPPAEKTEITILRLKNASAPEMAGLLHQLLPRAREGA